MALRNINNLSQDLVGLINVFSDMEKQIIKVKKYYNTMRNEAKNSFDDSKQYWTRKAYDEGVRNSALISERKAKLNELVREIDLLERQLSSIDKSYAKRFNSELCINDYQSYDLSEASFDRFMMLQKEALEIGRECVSTIKFQPIQEIGMLFSNKRKQKYERLNSLIIEIHQLKRYILSELDSQIEKHNKSWNEKREDEIDKAALETAELIEAIDNKEKQEVNKIVNKVNCEVDKILSNEDVILLEEMKTLIRTYNGLPPDCCEHILLGDLQIDVANVLVQQDTANCINEHFSDYMVGTNIIIPAIYDMSEYFNFCFDGHQNYEVVKDAIHSVIFSLIKNQPASRQRFILSDPEGRSRGFDKYLNFAKQYPDIFGEKIITTKEQIKHKLHTLSEYVDNIGQTKFVGYRDIFDYNSKVPDKQEYLRCLCLLNFPKYFDDEMFEDLLNIVKNGKQFGVQVLIDYDSNEIKNLRDKNQFEIIHKIVFECTYLEYVFGSWKYINGVSVILNDVPSAMELDSFINIFSNQYKIIKDTSLSLTKILCKDYFSLHTDSKMSIPIGKNEDGHIQSITLGEGSSHHALVIGSLGSGKSTLLHTIIMSSIINYSPDEINLYLMDFKSGTEFKVYANRNIPHIKLLALDAMQEFGQSILDELWLEMNRRTKLFNELIQQGMDVKDITDYRRLTGKKMPRILVIADEFQMMLSEEHNRKIASYCGTKLADFISLSRVYGIHFILATQTMSRLKSGFSIRQSTINEMYVRIGLKCIESECAMLFGDKNAHEAFGKMSAEKGSAVYVGDYSQENPVGFKVAFCNQDLQKELLDIVEEHYSLIEVAKRTKVFIGSSKPKLKDCKELNETCSKDNKSLPVFLGEPIRIDSPTRINLSYIKRNNLLIVGNNQQITDQLIGLYMVNVLRVPTICHKRIYLFDGLSIIGERLGENVNSVFSSYRDKIRLANDNYDVVNMVDELYSEYYSRKEKRQLFKINASNIIVAVINNMQWIESINLIFANRNVNQYVVQKKKNEVNNSSNDVTALLERIDNTILDMRKTTNKDVSKIPYGKKVEELIENGYTCGIHFVMSAPDYYSIKDYSYNIISKFSNKILFDMSNEDARRLISDANTENLKENIVIYYDGKNQSYQMKPYTEINDYLNRIKEGIQ